MPEVIKPKMMDIPGTCWFVLEKDVLKTAQGKLFTIS